MDVSTSALLVEVERAQHLSTPVTLGDLELDVSAVGEGNGFQGAVAIGSLQSSATDARGVAPAVDASAAHSALVVVGVADVAAPVAGVGDAPRLQRVGQVQRTAVDREALDAADEVVAVHLTGALQNGLDAGDAAQVHRLVAEVQSPVTVTTITVELVVNVEFIRS